MSLTSVAILNSLSAGTKGGASGCRQAIYDRSLVCSVTYGLAFALAAQGHSASPYEPLPPFNDVMATRTMFSQRSVHDWIATPAPLNTEKHGENGIFCGDNSVVEWQRSDDAPGGCVCYTSHPLPLGQVWQTTVLNISSVWIYGLVS